MSSWIEAWATTCMTPTRGRSLKVAGVRATIEGAGAALQYLPPYRPDFNPIEQVFSKLKTLLRSTQTRTLEVLWTCIGSLLERFGLDECKNYIRHCGHCGYSQSELCCSKSIFFISVNHGGGSCIR